MAKAPGWLPAMRRLGRRAARVLQAASVAAMAALPSQGGSPAYADIAERSGLREAVTYGSSEANAYILETTGTGAAIFDFDRDGDNDIFVVNGTTFPAHASGGSEPSFLYVNDGSGGFREAAGEFGLVASGWGQAACVGDIDNDGWDDLLVTYYGSNVLYRNANGTFRIAADGLPEADGQRRWGAGCAFLDYNSDGLLDIFVASYVDFDPGTTPKPGSSGACEWKGIPVMCGPRGLPRALNMLYRNAGDGRFEDVSRESGILEPGGRYALGAVAADFDNDGDTDVYVACDMTPSLLYSNNGDGTFTDVAPEAGVAYNVDGQLQAGMGVAVADYDGNGYLDIAKTNFSGDLPSLYRNENGAFFDDVALDSGLAARQLLGWGALFVDADEDGAPDLLLANGHVYPEVDAALVGETYRQPTVFYRNRRDGTFEDATDTAGPALRDPRPARGLAAGDLDGDGHPEIVVVNVNAPPTLLKNPTPDANAALIRLRGTESNRSAIGAQVSVLVEGRLQLQAVAGGGSYFSQSDLTLHFGLGQAESADAVEITWPTGLRQRWTDLKANRRYEFVEGRRDFDSSPLDRPRATEPR